EEVPRDYQAAVHTLADWHAGVHRATFEVYAFPDPSETTVRLVEVSDEFPDTGEVVPVTFGRSEEFPFRSSVVLLTPEQWQQVLRGELGLPEGWDLATRQKVWPNARG